MTKYVWIVDNWNLDDLCEFDRTELREVAVMQDFEVFSSEVAAVQFATKEMDRIFKELEEWIIDDSEFIQDYFWKPEHTGNDLCYRLTNYNCISDEIDWEGHIVRVTRKELNQ